MSFNLLAHYQKKNIMSTDFVTLDQLDSSTESSYFSDIFTCSYLCQLNAECNAFSHNLQQVSSFEKLLQNVQCYMQLSFHSLVKWFVCYKWCKCYKNCKVVTICPLLHTIIISFISQMVLCYKWCVCYKVL